MEIKAIKNISPNANLIFNSFDLNGLKSDPLFKSLKNEDRNYIERVIGKDELNPKKAKLVHLPSNPKRVVIIIGLGAKKDWTRKKLFLASRRIIAELKANKVESAIASLEDLTVRGIDAGDFVALIVQNLVMADYSFVTHKAKPKTGWPVVRKIEIYSKAPERISKYIAEGKTIGEAVNSCRELANTPGGIMTPEKLANAAKRIGKAARVKVKVLDKTAIKKLGMGGLLGVSSGSAEKPKFIILEYGPLDKPPIVFVGKGITFDSGGIDIKRSGGAIDMKMDMSGGAAVITAIAAISRLKIKAHVVGLVPVAENMPSGSSYRPGDILKTITGKTIEVANTDAEGRVILADALGYAQRYKPALVVDVATLTGAAMIALGSRTNAVFSNKEKLLEFSKEVGDKTGDYAWPLPAWDEYDEEIEGTTGDFVNSGKLYPDGGAITGAVFLKQFVGNYPWIHLDIAPMMTSIEGQYLAKGATGTGVRFLIEIARSFK